MSFANMEIKVLENKKNKIMLDVKGVDHTLCNALKSELWSDKHVKIATYSMKHPQINLLNLIVETDGEVSPKNAVINAVQRLHKTNEKFKKEFAAGIK